MTRVAYFGAGFPAYRAHVRSSPKVHRRVLDYASPRVGGSRPPRALRLWADTLGKLVFAPGTSVVARARGIAKMHVAQPLVLEVYRSAMLLFLMRGGLVGRFENTRRRF